MQRLEDVYEHHRTGFNGLSRRVCDSAFHDLRMASNIDSLLSAIIRQSRLDTKIRYASTIEFVEIAFQRDRYIPLSQELVRISGTLEDLQPNNLAKNITVS